MHKISELKKLFEPRTIVIIGASRDPEKIGSVIWQNIIDSGYSGKVFLVNPNTPAIQGEKTFGSVLDVPVIPDLAVVAIPALYVNEVVEECGQKGIKNVVIISAGFSEANTGGQLYEWELIKTSEKYNINILGPNCLGFINLTYNLNATFAATLPQKGDIVFLSQSGAMGTSFLDWAKSNNVGISQFVSLGNKADLNENNLLRYFSKQKSSKIILMYLEDFADGEKFFSLASKITKEIPIIILKPGRTTEARTAVQSHTGSLAQDERIIDTALKQSGCIRVNTIEEMFNLCKLLSWQPLLKGNRVAVITNAGGVGIQTVDELEQNGLDVVTLSERLQSKLNKFLPEEASTANPVDILGDAQADRYKKSLELVIKSHEVDAVLALLTPQRVTQSMLTAKHINEIADKNDIPVVASFIGGAEIEAAVQLLTKERIPDFAFPNDAAQSIGLLWKWQKQRIQNTFKFKNTEYSIINTTLKAKATNGALDLAQAKSLFTKFNIPLLPSYLSTDLEQIKKVAQNMEYPLVMKLIHPLLVHKTEMEAVILNIRNEEKLVKSYDSLTTLAKKQKLENFKIEIQPFLEDKMELIVGIKKDHDAIKNYAGKEVIKSRGFGHTVLVGGGGIYTEIYLDTALRLLPINLRIAEEMLAETKIGRVLMGARGRKYAYQKVAQALVSLSKLIEKNSNIKEIDINPLFVTKNDVYIADLKVFV